VGLNTGRPERIRFSTLQCLNRLGQEYRVQFEDVLLFMNPSSQACDVVSAKVRAIRHFRQSGYRIFAAVDNEPENLEAISLADPENEILLLHADTLFKSKRDQIPKGTVGGKQYSLEELASFKSYGIANKPLKFEC